MKDLKIFTENVAQPAVEQIDLLLEQEAFKDCKIRIMPDVHAGKGCVIGFTGNLGDKVVPNIIGVDLGCGMLCVSLEEVDIDFNFLDDLIKKYIPNGFAVQDFIKEEFPFEQFKCFNELNNIPRLNLSLGSLGGGNHFIEIDKDENDCKYLIIHTGSRNLGKQVAEIYQTKAIDYCSKLGKGKEKEEYIQNVKEFLRGANRGIEIPAFVKKMEEEKDNNKIPDDLCYLEGELRHDYLEDMKLCQDFAVLNRRIIAEEILTRLFDSNVCLSHFESFESVHNYLNVDDNIIRKGAISAYLNQKVLIPMNMRDGCIIGYGKGNSDWNCSAPHGAGRVMSRTQAKANIQLQDFQNDMKDVFTTTANIDTIDEAPAAYKPMAEIIANIKDTVEIDKIITPLYNFKSSEKRKKK